MLRAQLSLEFLLVFSFVLLVFLFLFALIASQRSTGMGQQTFSQLQLAAQNIASQIDTAVEAGTYSASIPITNRIGNTPFNVTITSDGAVITSISVGTQVVQAIAYSMARSIVSNPSFKQSNGAYLIPIANSTLYVASANGQLCIDYDCLNTTQQASSISLQSQVVHAAQLSGPGSHINIPYASSLNSGTFTVSFWMQQAFPSNTNYLYTLNFPGIVSAYFDANDLLWANFPVENLALITPSLGKWYNLILVDNGTFCRAYINSAPTLSWACNSGVATGGNFIIGSGISGSLANVQYYNAPVNSIQARSIYYSGIGGSPILPANVLGWWPLNGNAKDYSGFGNNGAASGPVLFPTAAEIFAKVTNSFGSPLNKALVGFASSLGTFGAGNATANYTNANGVATAVLSQNSIAGQALVRVTAYNGNSSLTANLIGWWPLSEGQGSTAYDISGNGNIGTLVDTAWSNPDYATSFDGQSYITLPTSAVSMNSVTLVFWTYPAAKGRHVTGCSPAGENNASVIAYLGSASSSIMVAYNSSQGIYLGGASNNCAASFADTVPTKNWTQIAIVQNASSESIYINGAFSGNTAAATGSIGNMIIGSSLGSTGNGNLGDYNFQGLMSNVQLYSTALSGSQLQQLYSSGISGIPIFANLVGWWPLNGNANDYSGNGNNGTAFGDTAFVPLQNYANSTINSASSITTGSFNGASSTINVGNSNSLMPASFTISGWADFNTNTAWIMIDKGTSGSDGTYYIYGDHVSSGGGNGPDCTTFSPTGSRADTFFGPLTTNTFYLLTCEFNASSGTVKTFVNGVQVNSHTGVSLGQNTYNVRIGNYAGGGYFTNGNFSNIQVYSTPLSSSEVQTLYKEGISGLPITNKTLVGWWPLNGNANDYSGNGNNGTATNVAYVAQKISKPATQTSFAGTGANFNGQNSYVRLASYSSFPLSSSARTIIAWVNPSSCPSTNDNFIVAYGTASGSTYGTAYTIAGTSSGSQCLLNTDLYGSRATSTFNIPLDSWSFVVSEYTGSGNTITLCINNAGCQHPTLNGVSPNTQSGGNAFIGLWVQSGLYWDGTIANIQVYNTALTSSQIQQLYSSQAPPSAEVAIPLGWSS